VQKIQPFLWFNNNAEEAVSFYLSVFKNGKAGRILRWGEGGPMPAGSVLTVAFELEGMEFIALNGGPHHSFTDAISFVVNCANQAEIDELWTRLTVDGGQEIACGWLRDKFGVSWQIGPAKMRRAAVAPWRR
jgi:predicted 3-demethylubiquinone-9 3-methyltransferase (glyoxalase superfamily)